MSPDVIDAAATKLAVMKIYDWPTGPYPARVRIAVAEKGMQSRVRFETVNLRRGEHKKPEFLAKNYSGTLPVLELDDGTLIAECTAITEYLDALGGAPTLTGRTPREKGLIHMMSKRAELELLDAISVYFHHATPGLGPDVEIYQNAEWGFRQRDKALRGMHYFDAILKRQPFVAGDAFSMADITVVAEVDDGNQVVPTALRCRRGWSGSRARRDPGRGRPPSTRRATRRDGPSARGGP